ncbi:MAG TPA: pseudouridine synthase [Flavisolibacter sp.]|nr:pseudouridine synthase [Flavisolibacter sp.]
MQPAFRYFIIHKPYGMESQFKVNYPASLLGDLPFSFPEGTHAIGRLDKHSEGLLLLTTNKKITKLLFQSRVPHRRTYLVQVKGKVGEESLQQLRQSVSIRISGNEFYSTPPCEAELSSAPAFPPPRLISPYVDSTWLRITITEGKFRQVRKMVAAIRHRCMRLIRVSIEDLELGWLQPGEVKEVGESVFFQQLKLENPPSENGSS